MPSAKARRAHAMAGRAKTRAQWPTGRAKPRPAVTSYETASAGFVVVGGKVATMEGSDGRAAVSLVTAGSSSVPSPTCLATAGPSVVIVSGAFAATGWSFEGSVARGGAW
jgi:hypothetical protein